MILKMGYPICINDNRIKVDAILESESKKVNYRDGLAFAEEVLRYLKERGAILITGPSELGKDAIQSINNAGEWVYHLEDTTLFAEIRPVIPVSRKSIDALMNIDICAAGRYAPRIISDLNQILEQYIREVRQK